MQKVWVSLIYYSSMLIWKDVTVWRAIKHIGMKLIAPPSRTVSEVPIVYSCVQINLWNKDTSLNRLLHAHITEGRMWKLRRWEREESRPTPTYVHARTCSSVLTCYFWGFVGKHWSISPMCIKFNTTPCCTVTALSTAIRHVTLYPRNFLIEANQKEFKPSKVTNCICVWALY